MFLISNRIARLFSLVIVASMVPIASAQGERLSGAEEQIRERHTPDTPAATVLIVLDEQFFNSLLDAILKLPQPLRFPLSSTKSDSCPSEISLVREMMGVRTAVRFKEGRITAPIAFLGAYNATSLVGCLKFQGTAETEISLSFEQARQALSARIQVREVNMEGLPPFFKSTIVKVVQNAIDTRINPLSILRIEQLTARFPVTKDMGPATGAGRTNNRALRLQAKEIRPEIVQNELRIYISYDIMPAE